MREARMLLTAVLAALLLIDGFVAFRFLRHGLPKHWVTKIVDGVMQEHTVPLAMTASAWLYLGLYILLHVVLCYSIWRLWRWEAVHP